MKKTGVPLKPGKSLSHPTVAVGNSTREPVDSSSSNSVRTAAVVSTSGRHGNHRIAKVRVNVRVRWIIAPDAPHLPTNRKNIGLV